MALQLLGAGADAGEVGIYVSLAETESELRDGARSHGWTIGPNIELCELVPESVLDPDQQQSLLYSSDLSSARPSSASSRDRAPQAQAHRHRQPGRLRLARHERRRGRAPRAGQATEAPGPVRDRVCGPHHARRLERRASSASRSSRMSLPTRCCWRWQRGAPEAIAFRVNHHSLASRRPRSKMELLFLACVADPPNIITIVDIIKALQRGDRSAGA